MISLRLLTLSALLITLCWLPDRAQQQSSQPQEAGEIREIKCKAYLKKPNTEAKKLNRKQDKGLKLYPLDEVKCVGTGTLELQIRGEVYSVKESDGWYPIPVPTNEAPKESYPARVGSLKGTFRSDDADALDLFPYGSSFPTWMTSLRHPAVLAIDPQGSKVTMASSQFNSLSFVADGREYEFKTGEGENIKAVATIDDKQLTIKATTETAQATAVISVQPDGTLKLNRVFSSAGQTTAVKETNYLRVSDLALLDVFPIESADKPYTTNSVLLRKGERIVAEVDDDISASSAKEGEEFTLTVKEPGRFKGAMVKGHLSDIKGTVLYLNFDLILLVDGAGYRFPGKVEVRLGRSAPTESVAAKGTVNNAQDAIFGIFGSGKRPNAGRSGAGVTAIYIRESKIKKGIEIVIGAVDAQEP